MSIIQLSELLENYNEKSAHRWVGNFSLQILTDLHPSKTPHMANFPFPTRVSVLDWEMRYVIKGASVTKIFSLRNIPEA